MESPGGVTMSVHCGPTELFALIKDERRVAEQRRLFCATYDSCLDLAVRARWVSWTCARCPTYREGPSDHLLDGQAVRRMAY